MSATPVSHAEELLIGGEWKSPSEYIHVSDIAREGTFTRIGAASAEEAEKAIKKAKDAEAGLRKTTVVERAEWMLAIADKIEEEKKRFVETIVREAGKPISSARSEVDSAAERFRRAAEEIRSLKGDYIEGTTDGHEGWEAIVRHEPRGAVLCITPYNYPLSTTALHVAPALAAGNAVILKPATKTPVSGSILAEIIDDTMPDFPNGTFSFVPGKKSEIGDVLAGDDRFNAIAMTGSSSAGNHVASVSGIVNLHMELGGNAPAVVLPSADLERASSEIVSGALKYSGQRCSAISRVLVHESVNDELIDHLQKEMKGWRVGDLFDPSTRLGPLISESQADWVEELVNDATELGATVVTGNSRDGRCFEPTLLTDVTPDARIIHEEQFGPVIPVTTFENSSEAVDIANIGDLGLDAAVFTNDHNQAMHLADQIQAGSIHINGAPSHGLGDIPFGGVKNSGIGREGLGYSIKAYTENKSIIL